MVIVHVISGDSSVMHITWIHSRVRIMVLNLQARQFTCSNHTHCKELPTHEHFMVENCLKKHACCFMVLVNCSMWMTPSCLAASRTMRDNLHIGYLALLAYSKSMCTCMPNCNY